MQRLRFLLNNNLFIYLAIFVAAFFLSIVATDPSSKYFKIIILGSTLVFFVVVPQRFLLFLVLFVTLFPRPVPQVPYIDNTTNGIILLFAGFLFLRTVTETYSVISFRRILRNPFFLPSVLIWLSYFVAWLRAFLWHHSGLELHTEFFMSITCALLLCNIITGFVKDVSSFRLLQVFLLLVLLLNLFFGVVFFFKPGLVLIRGIIEDNSLFAGQGANYALRLGGLNFFWEAYAQYLMMMVIVIFGVLINPWYRMKKKHSFFCIFLLFISAVELILTNTRGALVNALLGSIVVLFLFSSISLTKKLVYAAVFVWSVVGVLLVADQTGQMALFSRMQSFTKMEMTEYGNLPAARAGTWIPVIEYLPEHDFMGKGPSFIPLTKWGGFDGPLPYWPHNLILLIMSTVGVFGLGCYGFLGLRVLFMKATISRIANSELRIFCLILLLSLLFFAVDTMKYDGWLRYPRSYFYFVWILLGCFFSSANLVDNTSEQEQREQLRLRDAL